MATKSSEDRKRFGVNRQPIPATRAFMKPMEHFVDNKIDGKAWLLLNEETGKRVSINTYNGNAGRDAKVIEHPLPTDEKEPAHLVKGYTEVAVSDCPVATLVTKKSKKAATAAV